MSAYQYGYVVNLDGAKMEKASFASADFSVSVIAVSTLEMAITAARKLVAEGVSHIDFCGDFDDEKLAALSKNLGSNVTIDAAKYYPEQLVKLDTINMDRFAHIVWGKGFDSIRDGTEINIPSCEMKVIGVSSLEEACDLAESLVDEGIEFIELSSAFGVDETNAVINAVDGKAAIGSAGLKNEDL